MHKLALLIIACTLAGCQDEGYRHWRFSQKPAPDTSNLNAVVGNWKLVTYKYEYQDTMGYRIDSAIGYKSRYVDSSQVNVNFKFIRPDSFHMDNLTSNNPLFGTCFIGAGSFSIDRNVIKMDTYADNGVYRSMEPIPGHAWILSVSNGVTLKMTDYSRVPNTYPYYHDYQIIYREILLHKL